MMSFKKILSLLLALVLVSGLGLAAFGAMDGDTTNYGGSVAVSGTVRTKTGTVTVSGTSLPSEAKAMFNQINRNRQQAGLSLLSENENLMEPTMQRALEVSVSFSHTRPDGTKATDISPYCQGENLGVSNDSAVNTTGTYQDKVSAQPQSFMESSSHRSLILDKDMESLAVYCLEVDGQRYWVQLYGAANGGKGVGAGTTTPATTTPKPSTTTPKTTPGTTTTTGAGTAISAADVAAAKNAAASGKTSYTVKGASSVTIADLAAIAAGGNAGFSLNLDTTNKAGSVLGRLTLKPAAFSALPTSTAAINSGVSTGTADTKAIQNRFANWYTNETAVVKLDQKGSYGAGVNVAVLAELGNLNKDSLMFYLYDTEKNTIVKLEGVTYSVDSTGYLHFTASSGGYVVVADKALSK